MANEQVLRDEEAYDALAAAIVKRAYTDLRSIYYDLYIGQKKRTGIIDEVHDFFMSEWYHALTDIDPYKIDEHARKLAWEQAKKKEGANKDAVK